MIPHIALPPWVAALAPIAGMVAVLTWRIAETRSAVTLKKIVIPPLGMSTGLAMFLLPAFRIPWTWAALAFLTGATLFAYPLVRSSRLIRRGEEIMMHRSKAFLLILIGLAAVRVLAHDYIDTFLPPARTAGVFFLLAFGMILRWRAHLYFEYRRFTAPAAPSA